MSVETDGKDRITKIHSFRQLKLAKCRADKALKFPGRPEHEPKNRERAAYDAGAQPARIGGGSSCIVLSIAYSFAKPASSMSVRPAGMTLPT